jgi:hypothetical protein
MKKFIAKVQDFDLELVTLIGENMQLSPVANMNGSARVKIFNDHREGTKEKLTKMSPMEVNATLLVDVYGKPIEWWIDNFDAGTIKEIAEHVINTIAGIQKK